MGIPLVPLKKKRPYDDAIRHLEYLIWALKDHPSDLYVGYIIMELETIAQEVRSEPGLETPEEAECRVRAEVAERRAG